MSSSSSFPIDLSPVAFSLLRLVAGSICISLSPIFIKLADVSTVAAQRGGR